jgi:hypothetical protein
VPLPAIHLGAIPLQQIPGRTTHAGWFSKQTEALLAAHFLVAQRPSQACERKKNEVQYLEEVRGVRHLRKNRNRQVGTQKEGEEQYQGNLQCEKELTVQPIVPTDL